LGDLVYEQKISKTLFINTYGSDIMTSILVVVNKKKLDNFMENYFTVLLKHYENDKANWEKRTKQ